MNRFFRLTAVGPAALVLAGCAAFSPDDGMGPVAGLTQARTGHTVAAQRTPAEADTAQARVAELLQQPLGADSAVELALLNNRSLQASLAELGVAEAERVQAGRLRNPVLSFGRMAAGGVVEVERAIVFDLLGLLTMPAARQAGQSRFDLAQLRAAHEAVGIASDTRQAWVNAVAAQELVVYTRQVMEAADASSELARRMAKVGNFSQLEQMREQAFRADAVAGLARAQQQSVAARERLVRLLGLSGTQLGFTLPERLPDLPSAPIEPRDAEQTALDQRLDVLMARRSVDATAQALGLTRTTRFVDGLELAVKDQHETGGPRASGFEVELALPLFDFGGSVRDRRAEATHRQAVHRAAEVAVNARSEVRESYAAYRSAYDLARHYRDEVVPLRKRISEENLLRYNGMLIGVFELLADAREQVRSVTGHVQALRDFWLAQAQLQTALTGRSPGAGTLPSPSPSAASEQAGGH